MSNETSSRDAAILVVDDNEANRLLAQGTLEDEGYRVIVASGGAEGISAFEREKPACILLDVRMPEVDGFAVCEHIRALPGGTNTPVIFLTALRDVDTFDRALRAGGDDFVTKPFRPTELVVRVQTALKLRSARAELAEHYELLKRQRDDLMRVQLQKERLMAFVVHDLKNPVNSIDLHAQVVMRDRSLTDDVRASIGSIRAGARQLNRMIMNLLDLSKADEGKVVPRRVEVPADVLVKEVFSDLEVVAHGHKVALESSISAPIIYGDEDLLRRLLANLVENAIRHAPPGSAVSVSIAPSGAAWNELRVADAGAGIPLELREKIFDPFVQAEVGIATRSGRGLGLTFCKMAAEAHGGTISAHDASPGTVFCVRLPAHV
jgi:signal transduction histidine kinase